MESEKEVTESTAGPANLLTLNEAAARLRITPDQVKGLVDDGKLKYINVGRGKKTPRYRFAETDLADFIDARRTREEPRWQFSKRPGRRSTSMTQSSKVIGFAALREQRTSAKLKR